MSTLKYASLVVRDIVPYPTGLPAQEANFFVLRLEHPALQDKEARYPWKPGQFAMLRPQEWGLEMPWARALSICRVTDETVDFFFQIAGRGTRRMASLCPGDIVNTWGPLGKGFALEENVPTLLLAGGMGLAPFIGYSLNHPHPERLHLMFSHRPVATSYPLEFLRPAIGKGMKFDECHETSPEDRTAFLTEVASAITATARIAGLVLACGPTPFLRYVQSTALACGARAQVSLENRMGCGVGACLGCVCSPRAGGAYSGGLPVRTCVSGPVFWVGDVVIE